MKTRSGKPTPAAEARKPSAVPRQQVANDALWALADRLERRVAEAEAALEMTRKAAAAEREQLCGRLASAARQVQREGWRWEDRPDGPVLTPPKVAPAPAVPAARPLRPVTLTIEDVTVTFDGLTVKVSRG